MATVDKQFFKSFKSKEKVIVTLVDENDFLNILNYDIPVRLLWFECMVYQPVILMLKCYLTPEVKETFRVKNIRPYTKDIKEYLE